VHLSEESLIAARFERREEFGAGRRISRLKHDRDDVKLSVIALELYSIQARHGCTFRSVRSAEGGSGTAAGADVRRFGSYPSRAQAPSS
jgi:hypothetical protein